MNALGLLIGQDSVFVVATVVPLLGSFAGFEISASSRRWCRIPLDCVRVMGGRSPDGAYTFGLKRSF